MAGRPKGSKNKTAVVGGPGPANAGPGHNKMNDDQLQSLTRQHALKRKTLLEAEASAKASRMNFDKVIKSDLGPSGLDNIKLLQKLETPEGELEIKEDLERRAMVARWAGLQIGTQGSLFDEDRRAITERAFEDGKRAGLGGKDCAPPHAAGTEASNSWLAGWHDGQATMAKGFKSTKKPDAELVKSDEAKSAENNGGSDDFDNAANGDTPANENNSANAAWPDDAQVAAAAGDSEI